VEGRGDMHTSQGLLGLTSGPVIQRDMQQAVFPTA